VVQVYVETAPALLAGAEEEEKNDEITSSTVIGLSVSLALVVTLLIGTMVLYVKMRMSSNRANFDKANLTYNTTATREQVN